jgi:hypothetical protein
VTEETQDGLKLHFDGRLRLEFHGGKVTSDSGLQACRELDEARERAETTLALGDLRG